MRGPLPRPEQAPTPVERKLVKRKAFITVEYDAEDVYGARAQEGEIRRVLADLQPGFDRIAIRFADRRQRCAPRAAAPERIWPRD
ncbi:hypothetical protein [Caulobacter mirabilis]|uniref:hypothetical protein n=1 Tax=Caulobacter mirabilis TaxID=69666 RepID=UPI0012375D96|nr:hypothetical protein [Caulobacter mirabilis]